MSAVTRRNKPSGIIFLDSLYFETVGALLNMLILLSSMFPFLFSLLDQEEQAGRSFSAKMPEMWHPIQALGSNNQQLCHPLRDAHGTSIIRTLGTRREGSLLTSKGSLGIRNRCCRERSNSKLAQLG